MTADVATWTTVADVVFPVDGDEDVLPLYLDHGRATVIEDDPAVPARGQVAKALARARAETASRSPRIGDVLHVSDILSRHSARFPGDLRVSFATYFNAFPAAYWRRWTTVRRVRLTVRVEGEGTLTVYRSNARGIPQRVALRRFHGQERFVAELGLDTFGDGGWYWFDLATGTAGATLLGADWQVEGEPTQPGSLSIGTTTMNRVPFLVETVRAIAADETLRAHLDTFYVVDQGSDKVLDHPEFVAAAEPLGSTIQVVVQDNLGGAGGFSRGMYETLRAGTSRFHLCIDDDVTVETEAILRALRFAWFTRHPTIVGGHMFDLYNRTVLHAWGESVDPGPFMWGPNPGLPQHFDIAGRSLRQTEWMHRRHDVGYNGWWMCLIPTEIIREIGLALPVFIKWDDAEYALRAREAGYATVTLPGAAIWHVSWGDKDDGIDWGAYFHARNRTIAALLHSPRPYGGILLRDHFATGLKHGLSMQYYSQHVRQRGLQDVLSGPDHLHRDLATILPALRALTAEFTDARFESDPEAFPLAAGSRPDSAALMPTKLGLPRWLAGTARRHLRSPDPAAAQRPEVALPGSMNRWWILPRYDSAVVSKADGSGAAWYQRDPAMFRSLMRNEVRLNRELRRRWDELRELYRAQLPQYTSIAAWERTFGLAATGIPAPRPATSAANPPAATAAEGE